MNENFSVAVSGGRVQVCVVRFSSVQTLLLLVDELVVVLYGIELCTDRCTGTDSFFLGILNNSG